MPPHAMSLGVAPIHARPPAPISDGSTLLASGVDQFDVQASADWRIL